MDRFTDAILSRHRIISIAWALLCIAGAVLAAGLEGRIVPGGEAPASSQAERVARELSRNGAPSLFIVVTGAAAKPDASGRLALRSVMKKVGDTPGVGAVARLPLPRAARGSGPVTVLGVSATGGIDGSIDVAHKLLNTDRLAPADSRTFLGGYGAHREELIQLSRSDLVRAERVGLPIVFVVLLLTFGSLWASLVPLVIALTALLGGLGAAGALAFGVPLSEYVTNSASMIGLALAVDYAMFLVQRVRESMLCGAEVDEAIRAAMRTTGVAIAWSGLTVILAEAAMLLVDSRAIRTAAIGLILVTFCALVAALVGAPIVLHLLGQRVLEGTYRAKHRRPKLSRLRRLQPAQAGGVTAPGHAGAGTASEPAGFWGRWGRRVTGRAPLWLAGATLLLLALAVPALKLDQHVNISPANTMPAASQVRQASEISTAAYGPGMLSPVQIIVRGTPQAVRKEARLVARSLGTEPEVRATAVAALDRADAYRVSVTTTHAPADDRTHALVQSLRDGPLRVALAGVRYEVGGETAMRIDATDALFASLPLALAVMLSLVMVLLVVAMRSIVLPIKAILLVVVSLGASTGGLLLLSTTELGARLIGSSQPADLHPIVPITIVAIVIALATDYEVILISRIAERYKATGDNTGAIVDGVAHTGRVISSAAAIMIAVFFGFALSEVTPLKQIGVGLALAVLIDATIIRGVLVPASMQLMGRWNWWLPGRPGGLRRLGRAERTGWAEGEAHLGGGDVTRPGLVFAGTPEFSAPAKLKRSRDRQR